MNSYEPSQPILKPANSITERVGAPGFEHRPTARGKFIFVGGEKFLVRGVTYGAFRPDASDREYEDRDKLAKDFAQMAASGVNTVRIPHTMPPRHLLDIAATHGLRVMVGLSAEQFVGYLVDRKAAPDIEHLVRTKVRICAGHKALLCYAVGNEIPAPVVRWLGRRRVERYIESLYRAIKSEDPTGLVTYVNYPTTEYLQLPFLDLLSFNVYLEDEDRLAAYLARLQNIAGDRPLLMSELGLDSLRNGEERQAEVLTWQIRTVFEAGCAGAFIFAWTDEWFRAGAEVDDWAFGLTDTARQPKPALEAMQRAYSEIPFSTATPWPAISVIVCVYNGARTVRETLQALAHVDYPDYEVIVVNDGSTDATPDIAGEFDVRLISTDNRGLSSARNTGWQAARGEIVAYIDDDAFPDAHWLKFLASTFMRSNHVGVGGPNVPPSQDGMVAQCVANAPGGPVHVLISDELAEHIPGCNMAFRREALEAIGGFDVQFRTAGDDVDLCWRLMDAGHTIGFNPGALVWHHRRGSVDAYMRQQYGYGRAEALLEAKWPERYNQLGHLTWAGRIYGQGLTVPLAAAQRVYHGPSGNAPFQSLYQLAPPTLAALPMMPEWYLLLAVLVVLSAIGLLWLPLLPVVVPLVAAGIILSLVQATRSAARSSMMYAATASSSRVKAFVLTTALHLLQPIARLRGRIWHGLTPWRQRGASALAWPVGHSTAIWTENWAPPETRVQFIDRTLRDDGLKLVRGGPFDRWDLAVIGGLLGGVRLLMAIEDHGAGTQYVRVRTWPTVTRSAMASVALFGALAIAAAFDHAWAAAGLLSAISLTAAMRTAQECAFSMGAIRRAVSRLERELLSD